MMFIDVLKGHITVEERSNASYLHNTLLSHVNSQGL